MNPTTTVALVNTNVNFSCSKETASDFRMLVIDGAVVLNNSVLIDKGIELVSSTESGYVLTILASGSNNRTRIQCFLSPCFSEEAHLIVVNCKERA